MMSPPLVSIALCTYNGALFLEKQLHSLLNQTYLNIEIIVVDDGSTDATVEIIKKLAEMDLRIKVFLNEKNLGFNQNFEKAIRLCSGEYVAISDQDDIWLPEKVKKLLNAIGERGFIFSNSAYINEEDQLTGDLLLEPGSIERQIDLKNYKNIVLKNFISGHTTLFKASLRNKIFPFPKHGFYDWWMGFVMTYEGETCYCPEVLTYYRLHDRSVIKDLQNQLGTAADRHHAHEAHDVYTHLQSFCTYQNLLPGDLLYLKFLGDAYHQKITDRFAFRLFRCLLRDFKDLFPFSDRKSKSTLKKASFLRRYCRGLI